MRNRNEIEARKKSILVLLGAPVNVMESLESRACSLGGCRPGGRGRERKTHCVRHTLNEDRINDVPPQPPLVQGAPHIDAQPLHAWKP